MQWGTFAAKNPEMAHFGKARLHGKVSYLATVRKDGSPRVHPVTPIIGQDHLFVFMEPTSPKGHDLRRNGRYALHCSVSDTGGGSGEFMISGQAQFIADAALRAIAVQSAPYAPADRYILFELKIEHSLSTVYEDEGVVRQSWRRDG